MSNWIHLIGFVGDSFMMGLAIGLTKNRAWATSYKVCFAGGLFTWLFNGAVLAHKLGLV